MVKSQTDTASQQTAELDLAQNLWPFEHSTLARVHWPILAVPSTSQDMVPLACLDHLAGINHLKLFLLFNYFCCLSPKRFHRPVSIPPKIASLQSRKNKPCHCFPRDVRNNPQRWDMLMMLGPHEHARRPPANLCISGPSNIPRGNATLEMYSLLLLSPVSQCLYPLK